jgi:hypothetical protein
MDEARMQGIHTPLYMKLATISPQLPISSSGVHINQSAKVCLSNIFLEDHFAASKRVMADRIGKGKVNGRRREEKEEVREKEWEQVGKGSGKSKRKEGKKRGGRVKKEHKIAHLQEASAFCCLSDG